MRWGVSIIGVRAFGRRERLEGTNQGVLGARNQRKGETGPHWGEKGRMTLEAPRETKSGGMGIRQINGFLTAHKHAHTHYGTKG